MVSRLRVRARGRTGVRSDVRLTGAPADRHSVGEVGRTLLVDVAHHGWLLRHNRALLPSLRSRDHPLKQRCLKSRMMGARNPTPDSAIGSNSTLRWTGSWSVSSADRWWRP